MSDNLRMGEDLQSEENLLILLRNGNHKFILNFFDVNFGFKFCTQQSGEAFESCVSWITYNSRNAGDAKKLLLPVFQKFYRYLPTPVKAKFDRLTKEIGFDPKKPPRSRARHLWIQSRSYGATIAICAKQYLAGLRANLAVSANYRGWWHAHRARRGWRTGAEARTQYREKFARRDDLRPVSPALSELDF